MKTVTAAELQKQFGTYRDMALIEPISITHHGRDSLVMLSVDEYKRLKSWEEKMNKETEKMMDARVAVHRTTLEKLALK